MVNALLGISISLFLSALGLDITMWRWWAAMLTLNISFLLNRYVEGVGEKEN